MTGMLITHNRVGVIVFLKIGIDYAVGVMAAGNRL